jgi:eukaryotic-like serine/threonine-protein kinase
VKGAEGPLKPERRQQIAELFHAVHERGAGALVGVDPDLRREVESLMAQDATKSDVRDHPSESAGMSMTLPAQVAPGAMLGPYTIEAQIGHGGMGEVWKAHDTRLRRRVAIKTLHAQFSDRFEREAHSIAALNHPHICALYDVGPNFLVMELLEGDTLAERLKKGKLSIAETVKYGGQIAGALAEAHGKGVIHRDLKPGNVVLTKNGAKVLDFGLAKSVSDETLTVANAVMGTPAYMAPEQREGRDCDARTDIFSLGLLLYEMASGMRTASGVTPKMEHLPEGLAHVIERCLAIKPDDRWQSATDVAAELELSGESPVRVESGSNWQSGIRAKYVVGIAAVSLLLIAGSIFFWQRTQAKPLTDQDVLVLADFTNTTGDPAFDGALRQALAFELEQSPFLKVMDDQQVNQTLQLMGRPAGQRITDDIAHEVCVREGEKATIGGSITIFTKTYQITLQAINCQTGATLAREQAEAEDKDHVLKAVAQAATGMRAKLGESLTSIRKTARLLRGNDEVTTKSLEALKAYKFGMDQAAQSLWREGIPFFKRAIELDPNFASAHLFLGIAYLNTGQMVRKNESLTKAFALIDRVSERERFLISGMYYKWVTGESSKAIDAAEMLVRAYPRFSSGHHLLATIYFDRGEYERSLEHRQEEVRLEPRILQFQQLLMNAYVSVDRFDEAKVVLERALALKPDNPDVHHALLRIAYMQDDRRAQEKEIQWFAGKPKEIQSLNLQGMNAIVRGQRRQAKELGPRMFEMARRQGLINAPPPPLVFIDAQVGDCEAARKARLNMGLCLDASALRIAQERAAKNPPQNPDTADLLYQRGLAALTAGKGAEAAAEFQKIVDHKGRNWGIFYSPAYLGLARAQVKAGDTAKARRAYQDFLTLWKDADKDLPFYIQATKELAELH